MLIERRKIPFFTLWKLNGSSFEQTWIPFNKGCFVPTLVEIGQVVQEKKISELCQCIYAISYYVSLEKKRGPANSFEQTLISITQGCSVQSLVEIDSGEDFQISLMYFCYFLIIPLWIKMWLFIWTNFNPLNPMMPCDKFSWNWYRWVMNPLSSVVE